MDRADIQESRLTAGSRIRPIEYKPRARHSVATGFARYVGRVGALAVAGSAGSAGGAGVGTTGGTGGGGGAGSQQSQGGSGAVWP